jgi:hypothetical protein
MKKFILVALFVLFTFGLVACGTLSLRDNQWINTSVIGQTLPKGTIILANKPVDFPGDSESKEKNGKALNGIIILMGDKLVNTTDKVWLYKTSYEVIEDTDIISKYQKVFETKEIPKVYFTGH